MATYIKDIGPNSVDSHQVSPGYVLTFTRWRNRDTFNYDGTGLGPRGSEAKPLDTRTPLVVYNDATNIVINNSKKGLAPTLTCTLKGGDIDYSSAVHAGDFVICNMVNWESEAEEIRNRAVASQPINGVNDGFKGIFKVQSVVENVSVDPASGIKSVTYSISAAGFTEFNNVIFYNPAIVSAFKQEGTFLFQTGVSTEFANLLKSRNDIQTIIKTMFKILIGQPLRADVKKEIQNFGNTHFKLPDQVGKLLNNGSAKFASDLYHYIVGVQGDKYTNPSQDLGVRMNPSVQQDSSGFNFFNTGKDLQGNKQVAIDNWNGNTAWSLINGYVNSTINEIYTTYRAMPDNSVQPVVIVRQKPFTSEHFENTAQQPITPYFSLPRWRISPVLMRGLQTAKNEQLRFNFVQVYTRTLPDPSVQGIDMANQIALKNFVADKDDIQRHGLKPKVMTANFDFPGTNKPNKRLRAKQWAELTADWIIGGQLRKSGTVTFQGIVEPISVGDNIEIDNVVYHIESLSHAMSIKANGKKTFTTKMEISFGMDVRSSKSGPVYANMEHTDYYTRAKEDYANEGILPATSDTQDIIGRTDGEEVKNTRQQSFTPPNLRKKRQKRSKD